MKASTVTRAWFCDSSELDGKLVELAEKGWLVKALFYLGDNRWAIHWAHYANQGPDEKPISFKDSAAATGKKRGRKPQAHAERQTSEE